MMDGLAAREAAYQAMIAKDKPIQQVGFLNAPDIIGEGLGEEVMATKADWTPETRAGLATAARIAPDAVGMFGGLAKAVYDAAKRGYYNYLPDIKRNFGQSGAIHGPNSELADLNKLKEALAMKAARKNPYEATNESVDEIFKKTKWYVDHPDGVPRFEVSDKGSKINNLGVSTGYKQGSLPYMTLSQNISNTSFAKGYDPFTVSVFRDPSMDGGYIHSSILPSGNFSHRITYGTPTADNVKVKTDHFIHELQHAIQEREGMATGGDPLSFNTITIPRKPINDSDIAFFNKMKNKYSLKPSAFQLKRNPDNPIAAYSHDMNEVLWKNDKIIKDLKNKLNNDVLSKKQKDNLTKLIEEKTTEQNHFMDVFRSIRKSSRDITISPNEQYKNLAGEIEANLAMSRRDMAQTELDADPFYKYYPKAMSILYKGIGE